YIYLNKADLSFAHFSFLSKYLVKNNTDIDDAFSFTDISLDLYDRCNSLSCFRKFNEAEKSMKVKDQLEIISYRLNENSDLQKLYLGHREFQKWDLVKIVDLNIRNKKFTLSKKGNKIYFKAWGTTKNPSSYQSNELINVALQFTVKGDKVYLQSEEVGTINKNGLELRNNFQIILHDDGRDQVLALIKI